jgi:hypothetical protein
MAHRWVGTQPMYSRAQIFDFIVGVGHWPISTAGVAKVNFFNPPSSTVTDSKLQVNRPKSLSCIIISLAAALRDSSYRAAEQLSRPAEQAGKVRACRGAASPHPAGYLGQVDVLTSGHALSVIHPNTPGPGRVRGTCGDASGAVRPVHAQRWLRQADPRRFSQRLEE